MAEVTIRYVRRIAGHPEPGSQITVERTNVIDMLLDQGYAVRVLYSSDGDQTDTGEDDGD